MPLNKKLLYLVAYLDVCEVLQQLCRLLMLGTHLHNLYKHSTLLSFGFGDQVVGLEIRFGDHLLWGVSFIGQPTVAAELWVSKSAAAAASMANW